jgi:hypothetical protein
VPVSASLNYRQNRAYEHFLVSIETPGKGPESLRLGKLATSTTAASFKVSPTGLQTPPVSSAIRVLMDIQALIPSRTEIIP